MGNKRAIEVSLVTILEIAVGIGVVLLLIYLGAKLGGLFIGRQAYDSTMNNMEALANIIMEMAKENKGFMQQSMVYSITDDYILVGFSYDNQGNMGTQCTEEKIIASRPKLCQSQACICIYENSGGITDWKGKDFDTRNEGKGTSPLRCRAFEESIIFLAFQDDDENFLGAKSEWKPKHHNTNYENLVIYGECGGPWKGNFGIKQLYIEKYVENNGSLFVIIGDSSSDKTRQIQEAEFFVGGKTASRGGT